jgi:hypothetical protein
VRVVHQILGWAIVGGFGLLWLWSMGTWLAVNAFRRASGPGRPFWWLLAVLQGSLLVQGLGGTLLLITGGRASALHYVYGFIFPALVLLGAHVAARNERWADRPWMVFGWAGFVVSASTARALLTGLGWS